MSRQVQLKGLSKSNLKSGIAGESGTWYLWTLSTAHILQLSTIVLIDVATFGI